MTALRSWCLRLLYRIRVRRGHVSIVSGDLVVGDWLYVRTGAVQLRHITRTVYGFLLLGWHDDPCRVDVVIGPRMRVSVMYPRPSTIAP